MATTFVGIQISGISFLDEGVEQVLDTLQEKGAVNTLLLCTQSFDRGVQGRQIPGQPWPDHGKHEPDQVIGGCYATPHPEYFRNTCLPAFRAPDPEFQGVDILELVLPKAQARGLKVFAWIYENPYSPVARYVPNWPKVLQVDLFGRRHSLPCFRNQDYVNWWLSIVEDHLKSYPLDGLQYGSERQGPLMNLLQGGTIRTSDVPYCFCRYCQEAGAQEGINVERARMGYRQLYELCRRLQAGERPVDGAYVTFLRLLLRYPEILAWERLWHDGFEGLRKQIYGTAKAIAPEKPVGWHIWHQNSFSPLYRAENDFAEMVHYSDYLKPVLYHNCAGPRFHRFVHAVHKTVYADVEPGILYAFLSDVLGYDEAPLEALPTTGFSGEYVRRETARTVAATQGRVPIYPGIDIDTPTGPNEKKTRPEDVRAGIIGAFEDGASGVILSRKYSEMWLDNLAAAGATLRELGKV